MPRAQAKMVLPTDEERDVLERRSRAARTEQRAALRARIVLGAADGESNGALARRLSVTEATVRKWRGRFAAERLLGLGDRPRSGRPLGFDSVTRCQVISAACAPVPADLCLDHWTHPALRQVLREAGLVDEISARTIGRILDEAELRPHRMRLWLHSPDPDFGPKVAEVTGLYLARPAPDEVVLCIDEKTGMQALSRRFAGRRPAPCEAGRWEFEYRRHGTRCLTAAFNVHTGEVTGRCTPQRRKVDLCAYLEEDVAERYPTGRIHVIWDNLNTHSGPHIDELNARHGGRFVFHYTPIHASWCNQIEIWFSILARRILRRASFRSTEELVERVMAFIDLWNRDEARPFRWTYTGKPLVADLRRAA